MNAGTEILNADTLLPQAQERTGLSDWGDSTLPERFRLAVNFLKSCNMDEAGQRAGAEAIGRSWPYCERFGLEIEHRK
ncbi:MAG: hypothetical protein ACLQUZ_12070 [Rhizomicrobium sp.]